MIKSKKDYIYYLQEDAKALGVGAISIKKKIFHLLAPNHIHNFQKLLRKKEFYKNCKKGLYNSLIYLIIKHKYRKISLKLGFSIPENVFGAGLSIVHYGTIIVNRNATIGANCRLHACTNIGASGGTQEAPNIGNNVYIGPGAKIYGNITIADNIAIGANATVFKSFNEENIMIAGNPATKIKEIDITRIIKHL